ncbi:MAG TPA: hypothetical protein PLQ21_02790 [Candidatus Kapabacteria bacterium]|nr:hypothetical protein [Candidatus Kapabacteria bacterium]
MLKNNWIKLLLTIIIAYTFLSVIFLYFNTDNTPKKAVDIRVVIPPELLGGKALSIGDSFEKVEKVEKLRELRYEAGRDFWGRKRYTKGKYEGIDTKYIQHAFFNSGNELLSIEILVNNTQKLPKSKLFVKTVETLERYYGEDYEIFGHLYDSSVYIRLEWKLSKHTSVEYSCALLDSNLRFREYAIINSVVRYDSPYTNRDTVGKSIVVDLLRGNKTVKNHRK